MPVTVLADIFGRSGAQSNCSVPCTFALTAPSSPLTADTPEGTVPAFDAYPAMLFPDKKPAHFGLSYYRHMESLTNYPDRAPEVLYASGVKIIMSHQLSSDAPATYLSWPGGLAWAPFLHCLNTLQISAKACRCAAAHLQTTPCILAYLGSSLQPICSALQSTGEWTEGELLPEMVA